MTKSETAARNDAFRMAVIHHGRSVMGQCVLTSGFAALPMETQLSVLHGVLQYSGMQFTQANDPYGEHDFGAVNVGDVKCFWKIDDYGPDWRKHGLSRGPLLLTIMLAEEY